VQSSNRDQTPSSQNSIYCRKETDNIKVKYYYYLLEERWKEGRWKRREKKEYLNS